MRGDYVIVRAFDGEPLLRVIWRVTPTTIEICDAPGYRKLRSGQRWLPIGFPRSDVFPYDAATLAMLEQDWQNYGTHPAVWDGLSPWQETDHA